MTEYITGAITVIVLYILGPISALHLIFHKKSSQGTVAWALGLITFPFVAVPMYWLFGRDRFESYVSSRQEGERQINHLGKCVNDNVGKQRNSNSDNFPEMLAVERLVKVPTLGGNDVELFIEGETTFQSIFKGINEAKQYVLVQFYIVNDDELGRKLQKILIECAKAGIAVYFLFDKVGSKKMTRRYLRELKDAGVICFDFNAKKGPPNRFRLNFRNHRKIVVVDGNTAWVGGNNVGDEYLGKGSLGAWRDTHMKLNGPAALPLQLSFVEDWHWATNNILDLNWATNKTDGDCSVLIVPTGPGDQLSSAALMFLHSINSAKERIWIASPYFVPDEAVVRALQLAGLRGVDVRILIPDNPDKLLVYLAAYSYLQESAETGVKFFRYKEGFMHQKVILVDNHSAAIGTANMDNRSFTLNFEVMGFVFCEKFNSEVTDMFENDFSRSHEMDPEEYKNYPFIFNLKVRMARLFAPLL